MPKGVREITHFYPEIRNNGGEWILLKFITRDLEGKYYNGCISVPLKDNVFGEMIESRRVLELPKKVVIEIVGQNRETKGLFLTSENEIYFASKENPQNDPEKIFIMSTSNYIALTGL